MRNLRQGRRFLARSASPRRDTTSVLGQLLAQPRFEVLPTPEVVDLVGTHLPRGRTLTVTASPNRGLEQTLATAEQLTAAGYEVIPHLAARMVTDAHELAEIVDRLRAADVSQIFVPSGDAPRPGEFPDAAALLRALAQQDHPFTAIGVTAYPESHPTLSDDQVVQAMWEKRHLATELVSNLTFDSGAVTNWLPRVRARGVDLPLWVGLPGAVSSARLLGLATRIGVGDSTRYLIKHPGVVARLIGPREFSAESFLRALTPTLADPAAAVAGLHVFTFNQVAETESWRSALVARLQEGGVPSR